MRELLANRPFCHLLLAQLFSLFGSGVATVALALLAYEIVGDKANIVIGMVLSIKMVAYVFFAPIAGALAVKFSRRNYLLTLDIIRAVIVLFLPFVDAIWQIYGLIFLLNLFTAAFSPVFQTTISDIVTDEKNYTKALSISKLVFNFETIASPVFAGLFISFASFHWLFGLTSIGFIISGIFIWNAGLLTPNKIKILAPIGQRLLNGLNIFVKTPRLRGLLLLNIAISLVGANIFTNSIIFAYDVLEGGEQLYLDLLFIFGIGSIFGALILPLLGKIMRIRTWCLISVVILTFFPFLMAFNDNLQIFYIIWFAIGFGISIITTSSGLLLRVSSNNMDQPAVFAAQFSLSHACWLVAYPLSAYLATQIGVVDAMLILSGLAIIAILALLFVWPASDPLVVPHKHGNLMHDHFHAHDELHDLDMAKMTRNYDVASMPHTHFNQTHSHPFVIDEHHRRWPNTKTTTVDK